jgi:ribosomal protein S18 acetylase RimI-like enzyme
VTFIFDTVARLLLEAGARLGATVVWLEVDDDSGPARALYRSLGLRQHQRCRYLMLPAGGDGSVR